MKLFVASLLLVATAVAAKVAIEVIAPEGKASASDSVTRAKAPVVAGTVETVRFTGPGLRASFLSDAVATHEGAPLSQAALDADRIRIADALVARGHLDATAGAAVVAWSAEGAAYVDFPVETGPIYTVRSVTVEGKVAARHPGLATVPTLATGDTAAAERIEASAALLRAYLSDRDLRGTVTWTLERDPQSSQADLIFSVR